MILSEKEWGELIQSWIHEIDQDISYPHNKAYLKVSEWINNGQSDFVWKFISRVYRNIETEIQCQTLATHVIEDWLNFCGEKYTKEAVELSQRDPEFHLILRYVWTPRMMNEERWEELVCSWIEAGEREEVEYHWAIQLIIDWSSNEYHRELWDFILRTHSKNTTEKVQGILAAGPLEDLLADHGAIYVDEIIELSQNDPKFHEVLKGVWQNSMTDEVWAKVRREQLRS